MPATPRPSPLLRPCLFPWRAVGTKLAGSRRKWSIASRFRRELATREKGSPETRRKLSACRREPGGLRLRRSTLRAHLRAVDLAPKGFDVGTLVARVGAHVVTDGHKAVLEMSAAPHNHLVLAHCERARVLEVASAGSVRVDGSFDLSRSYGVCVANVGGVDGQERKKA